MRICSLVPGATEALFALGLGDRVVGVTHECDWPPEAAERPVVTASLVQTGDLASDEIDRLVAAAARGGKQLYAIDEERWSEIDADTVVLQELCEVCAVSRDGVDRVVAAEKLAVDLVDFSPTTLEGVMDAIEGLGRTFGAAAAADEVVAGMRARLGRAAAAVANAETSPRVFVSEWLDPPYAAGHWIPDMVEAAGGTEIAGIAGEPSHRMRWADVAELDPDVVVLAPCGYDLDRTLGEVDGPELSAHLLGTRAREDARVFAVDANASFSRPGPRLADGVEVLAHLLHPEAYPDPGAPWSRVRL